MFQLLESCDVKYFPSVVLSEEVLCSETFKQCRDSRVKLKLGKDEGKVEKEEDEEAEKEEEEDEGALQVDCPHCPRVLHPCGPDRKYLKGFAWEETATSDNSSKFYIIRNHFRRSQDVSCSGAALDRGAQRQERPYWNHRLSARSLQGSRQVRGCDWALAVKR